MRSAVLRERDFDVLATVIESIAEPSSTDDLRLRAVSAVPTLVRSTFTVWNEFDPEAGTMARPIVSAESREQGEALATTLFQRRLLFAQHASEQPIVQRYLRTRDGRPRAISDFYSRKQFQETTLYQQFYGPLGVEDQVGFQLPDPSLVVAITLHREWRAFTARDRRLLNLVRPHLMQSLHNARAYERMRRVLAALDHHSENTGEGLLLLDAHGRIDYASPNAHAILSRRLDDWGHRDLPSSLDTWACRGVQRPKAPPWPLLIERAGWRLTIRRLPVPGEADAVALLVTETRVPRSLEVLARLGLTQRQAQVLELARTGSTNAQIARQLNITINTVETHMTAGLVRLGVPSRTAAANLINQAMNQSRGHVPPG